jgi:hypothetical protein
MGRNSFPISKACPMMRAFETLSGANDPTRPTAPSKNRLRLSFSFPQANFIVIKKEGEVPDNVKVIGDLSQVPGVLALVGFSYIHSTLVGRDASMEKIKSTYYPPRKELLRNATLVAICKFVAIITCCLISSLPTRAADGEDRWILILRHRRLLHGNRSKQRPL